MSSRSDELAKEERRQMLQFAEVFARRESAKAEMLEDVLPKELYAIIFSTEGLGLLGEDLPIIREDWDIFRDAFRLYQSMRKRNPERELPHIRALIDDMLSDLAARSRNILAIQPLLYAEQIEDRMSLRDRLKRRPTIAKED